MAPRPSSAPPDIPALRAAVRDWFQAHRRQLAFRERAEPWGVLVSEVMAQQTQVSRVDPAWTAFMLAFPNPSALAAATPAAVLRAWAGMGYNRRALNLQRAAAAIVEQHGGGLPGTVPELEALPGVGPYTARAVAAIAFGAPVAAVDTNIRRVVGRLVAGHGAMADPGAALPSKRLQEVADGLVDPVDPAAWTHAMMDLGATVCRPVGPRCEACPLAPWCVRRMTQEATTGASGKEARPRIPVETARRARRTPHPAFPSTRRWLRGRIVATLRDLPDDTWHALRGPVGAHDEAAVAAVIGDLAREGMVEQRPDGAVRLPSTRR